MFLMDSNNHLYDPNHISSLGSGGLLRFRSAPSSVLAAFVDQEKGGFDSDRLLPRFVSSDDDLGSPKFDDKSPVTLTNTSVSYAATLPPPQPEPSSFLGLPPHYPRQSKGVMNSIGLDQFLGINNHHTKPVEPNLLRQSSSPAGMFTNLSDQNGTVSLSFKKSFFLFFSLTSFLYIINVITLDSRFLNLLRSLRNDFKTRSDLILSTIKLSYYTYQLQVMVQ